MCEHVQELYLVAMMINDHDDDVDGDDKDGDGNFYDDDCQTA